MSRTESARRTASPRPGPAPWLAAFAGAALLLTAGAAAQVERPGVFRVTPSATVDHPLLVLPDRAGATSARGWRRMADKANYGPRKVGESGTARIRQFPPSPSLGQRPHEPGVLPGRSPRCSFAP